MNKDCLWGLEPKDRHCEYCTVVCSARPIEQGCSTALILPLTIKATIEKNEREDYYSVYSDCKIGNSYLGGCGATKKRAREDFEESIREAMLENVEIEYNEN